MHYLCNSLISFEEDESSVDFDIALNAEEKDLSRKKDSITLWYKYSIHKKVSIKYEDWLVWYSRNLQRKKIQNIWGKLKKMPFIYWNLKKK